MDPRLMVFAAALLGAETVRAQSYGPGMMWDYGWGMHGFFHFLWWGLAAVVVVLLARRHRSKYDAKMPTTEPALAILRERYARGEIDLTEFETRKEALLN
jgi:putative membrane protein